MTNLQGQDPAEVATMLWDLNGLSGKYLQYRCAKYFSIDDHAI